MIRWLLKVAVLFIILTLIIAIGRALKADKDLEKRILSNFSYHGNLLSDIHFVNKKHFHQITNNYLLG
ncbi:hypothetical protein C7H79_14275 [Nitrosomonas supralitoralis]|uniref:Uncharacterized protein n=1 Tax=Nitrosomonas supralitoralis TaxID=2116706 RepID=A0A2P7NS27_9PROT|nr:hypothetical protein C7H79_14275 [Nitrosomonas supralitoralis]